MLRIRCLKPVVWEGITGIGVSFGEVAKRGIC
jgi:hypothetical protein